MSLETIKSATDVLVVGGGTAGTIAAIQAARAGANTTLLEMGSQLGGVTTVGGVSFPGLFHAWGKQVIRGIGWDLVEKTSAMEDRQLPDFTQIPERHWHHQLRINGQLYAALAEEAAVEAGVHICYYETPTAIEQSPEGWRVEAIGKGLRRTIDCRQLIDATGGADIVGMIGLERVRGDETQPGTLIFQLAGYDPKQLDGKLIQQRYEAALDSGQLQPGDFSQHHAPFMSFLRKGGDNAQHVFDADSSTSATKTVANIAGRSSLLRLLRFVRSLPGCERAYVADMKTETAVRETYRIVGEYEITEGDYRAGRVFDDAVCYAFYPIDMHTRQGVKPQPLDEGVVPTIPLRALAPRGSRNLLIAGRSVSSDRLANSGLRVQAPCMAMGQAAGVAAALAARQNRTPLSVPFDEIKKTLAAHDAIVPAAVAS